MPHKRLNRLLNAIRTTKKAELMECVVRAFTNTVEKKVRINWCVCVCERVFTSTIDTASRSDSQIATEQKIVTTEEQKHRNGLHLLHSVYLFSFHLRKIIPVDLHRTYNTFYDTTFVRHRSTPKTNAQYSCTMTRTGAKKMRQSRHTHKSKHLNQPQPVESMVECAREPVMNSRCSSTISAFISPSLASCEIIDKYSMGKKGRLI